MPNYSKYGLLVTPEEKKQAMYQGLLQLGAGLMAGSAPSLQPGGFARGLAQGGMGFQQGYQNYLNNMRQNRLENIQAQMWQQKMEQADAADQAAKAQVAYNRKLAQTLRAQGRNMEADAVEAGYGENVVKAMTTPRKPEMAKDVTGRQRYVGGDKAGELVFPGVKSPQDKFFEMIGEPPAPTLPAAATPPISPTAPAQPTATTPPISLRLDGEFSPYIAAGSDTEAMPAVSVGSDTEKQPTVRDIFYGLPPEVQAGIKMSADPMKAMSQYLLKSKGWEISTNPDGTVNITQGDVGGGYGKKQTGNIEEKLFNARESMVRLQTIKDQFKPEYQEIGTRMGIAADKWGEKLGFELTPDEKTRLVDFSNYKMNALDNINLGIKEMTGAQMSQPEAARLRQGMPDPGEDIFSGDSPSEFKAKVEEKIRVMQLAQMRYVYALKKGWDMDPDNLEKSMPLNRVEGAVQKRGEQIEQEVRARNPEMSDDAVQKIVVRQLRGEFEMVQ